jgi:hypothetical protein
MNFFKKNKKQKPGKLQSTTEKWEWSTQAIEVEYNVLIKDYEANPNDITARRLQYLSKKLNDRAYEQGNGKLYQEINESIPITQEKFNRMSSSEKENLKRIVEQKKLVDKALKKLSEPEPDLDVELDNYENEYGSVDRPSPNQVIHQTDYDKKQDEEVVLINEVEVKQVQQAQPPKKKVKIPGMNFFKKKKLKLKHLPKELDGDFVMKPKKEIGNAKTYSEEELQQALLQKEAQASVKLDHDPNMQTMSDPPKKQSIFNKPMFQKKEKTTKYEGLEEPKLKGLFSKNPKQKLPDLICPDCMHSIKAHTTKGESSGCKCGCLNTVETIAERHNVTLEQPKQQTPKESHDDVILKQAQKMASMKSEPKPIKPPEPLAEPSTKQRSLCANCDHIPKAHFDGNKFCTVIGCTCETYRAYPE